MLGSTFGPFFVALGTILPFLEGRVILSHAIPLVLILDIFWITVLQLLPDIKNWLESFLKNHILPCLRYITGVHWLSQRHPSLFDGPWTRRSIDTLASLFWFCTLGNQCVTFIAQILFAFVSMAFALAQKFTRAPNPKEYCDLSDPRDNVWGLSQMIPMFLLALPVLTSYEVYIGKYGRSLHPEPSKRLRRTETQMEETQDEKLH